MAPKSPLPPWAGQKEACLTMTKDNFEFLFFRVINADRFNEFNTHLTAAEKAGLLNKPMQWPKEKPVFHAYKPSSTTSFYGQVTYTGNNGISIHKMAAVYRYRFIDNKDAAWLVENWDILEASHLMNNYVGHQRDFNPNNLILEVGVINKSRDACALLSAIKAAKKALGDAFDYDTFTIAYATGVVEKEFIFSLPMPAVGGSSSQASEASITSENVDEFFSQLNKEIIDAPAPSLFANNLCNEVHPIKCRRYKLEWGLPAACITERSEKKTK